MVSESMFVSCAPPTSSLMFVTGSFIYFQITAVVGTFAIAYIMTKFTEPLRLGATVVAVPRISRAIGHRKHEHDDA